MPRFTVNGVSHEAPENLSLLKALEHVGAAVPHLCHDDRLKLFGGCRLCLVKIAGMSHPVTSCATPVADGMTLETHTQEIEQSRRETLTELARHYPQEAVSLNTPLGHYFREYGVTARGEPREDTLQKDDSHPYIAVDMNRCISCMRCVRICAEVEGRFVWQAANRGTHLRIVPDSLTTLAASSCVSCGACVDTCPSGALVDKTSAANQPTQWTRTVCAYCGTGCELETGTNGENLIACRPAPNAAVNNGHLCVKGRYAFDYVHAVDRVTSPMIREKGKAWRSASWEEALAFTAARLGDIAKRHGADALGFLGSARATNEENYLMQKLARAVFHTNNVDCCARVCHTPSAAALKVMLGTGAATGNFDDIEAAKLIFVAGANPTECHPVLGARLRQAKIKGAKLIVADPRKTELARIADIHLPVKPGGNIALFNAMAFTIIAEGLVDADFVSQRVAEWESFSAFIKDYAPEKMAASCGVDAALIRAAARLYASSRPAYCCHGLGLTEHTQGTEGVMSLTNLALLTGNFGKPGAGINPLRGQNNVQGSAHMGCDPSQLTGLVPIKDAAHRARFEAVWQAPLPTAKGKNLMQMIDAARDGTLKALWAFGFDVALTLANADETTKALAKLDCVIIQDLFLNETAKAYGTVFLPACSSFEKDGTFMNADRRVQRVRAALKPIGASRPDWRILCDIAAHAGHPEGFAYDSPEQIWDEIRTVWPGGAGLTYDRIARTSLHWPCPDEKHPGTPTLYEKSFAIGERAPLKNIPFIPTTETTDGNFPFLLNTGRSLYHFNAGTMSHRTKNKIIDPGDVLDMAPEDAARLGFRNGERVTVRSRYGAITLPLRVRDAIKPGELFTTFHDAENFVNRVTGPLRDRIVLAPEYKVTAVAVTRAP